MLDSEIVDYESINEDSYDGLVSLIEASQGVLSLLIASCKPGDFQTQIINRYEAELTPNIPCYRVVLNQQEPSLRAALEQLVQDCPELQKTHASAVITVTGTEALMDFVSQGDSNNRSELSRFFGYLQWTREGLREFPYPIVIWVTPKILSRLSIKAPDFWSWRSGVFRFVAPAVEATGVVNQTGEISLLIESERRETLPLDELLDQVESLEQQAMETPALATLYNRVANSYANRVKTGQTQDDTQEIDRAILFFEKSLVLQRELNLPQAESDTLLQLGDIYRDLGLWKRVFDLYEQSLEIARSLKDSLREAAALGRLGNLYQQYPLGDRANNLEGAIASYDETRTQAYLQLIQTLLAFPNGDEPQILQNNSELLDRGFLETCESVAATLAGKGQENPASFLRNLASQLGQFLDPRDQGDSDDSEGENSQEYANFILELLQAEQDSNSDIKIIYAMLAGRQHLLNHRFAETLYQVAEKLIAENPEAIESILATLESLSMDISNFPLGSRANNLEIAITGYEIVLTNREPGSEKFAQTQNNLAVAYSNRIRGEKADNIERAIASYNAALTVYTRDAFPQYWAMTQNNLAVAYSNRIREEKTDNIERAIASYNAALTVYTRDAFPPYWAMTQNNLGNAYYSRINGDRADNIEWAIASYNAALTVYTRDAFPQYWAMTQNNLGEAYSNRTMGDKAQNIEVAIEFYQNALQVYTLEAFPEYWATTQNNLGLAYSNRIRGDKAQNIELAKKCYENALTVRTLEAFPQEYTEILSNLGNLDGSNQ
ncbi:MULTISPECIES: tetratricopeptide repeat protein [unclassified Microcoleus]|uniref:tetratricopeptide repeat protein n=1 Tax=unclassified Microcoleus TaxID=2642155 RepID=UPI0025EFC0DE|nr:MULTISPECIES: tetratricopeptide repeat protein [unclassified Microcoleus]